MNELFWPAELASQVLYKTQNENPCYTKHVFQVQK